MLLEFNYELTVFDQTFSFLTEATLDAATELSFDCDSVKEFKSLLNAEEVFYKATNECVSNYQMSLL